MKLKEKAFWKSAWNLRANKESGNGCEIDGLFSRLFLIIDVIAPSPFCPIGDLKSVREKKNHRIISRMSAGLPPRPSVEARVKSFLL